MEGGIRWALRRGANAGCRDVASLTPTPSHAARSPAPPALHRGPHRLPASHQHQPLLRARHRRVQELAREDPRAGLGQ